MSEGKEAADLVVDLKKLTTEEKIKHKVKNLNLVKLNIETKIDEINNNKI
jgi:hypothetical protein